MFGRTKNEAKIVKLIKGVRRTRAGAATRIVFCLIAEPEQIARIGAVLDEARRARAQHLRPRAAIASPIASPFGARSPAPRIITM
jgi:hypothetical protein